MAEEITTDPKGGEEAGESADTGEEKGEEEEEPEEEVLDDSKYEPEQRRPWKTREERDEFFKEKQKVKGEEEGEEGDEGEKPITRKDLETILNPVLESIRTSADNSEIVAFLAANPQYKKYEKLARKDAQVYPNVPISKIFKALAHDDLVSGEAAKSAGEKAKKQKVGGTSARPKATPSMAEQIQGLTPEKTREMVKRIKRGEKIDLTE